MPAASATPAWMIEQGFTETLAQRFYSRINQNGPIPIHRPDIGRCHLWTGAISSNGYGCVTAGRTHKHTAHRIAWMLEVGPLESVKQLVLHLCDNRRCVRVGHLFLGNHKINADDMVAKGRYAVGPRLHGEENPKHRLTEAQILEIRRLRRLGLTYERLAEQFPASLQTMRSICLRKTWAHVPD